MIHDGVIQDFSIAENIILQNHDILTLSDRIAVLHEDQIMGVVERNDSNAEELGLMMAGVRTEQLAETKAAA